MRAARIERDPHGVLVLLFGEFDALVVVKHGQLSATRVVGQIDHECRTCAGLGDSSVN